MWWYTIHLISLASNYVWTKNVEPMDFLQQYGYIDSLQHGYDNSLRDAVKRMQKFSHLPETGVMDDATIKMMNSPRCGVSDHQPAQNAYSYRKWSHNDLTYKFENYTPDLPISETERIIKEAFQLWSDVVPLNFQQINVTGDFSIVFGRYYHHGGHGGQGRCNARFDGRGGVLAHAYFPKDGRAHFDDDELFTDKTRQGTNLYWVAAHEFGHALGLPHSRVKGALMYPYYTGYKDNFRLPDDDIIRIQNLYGPRSTLGPGETHPPTTKPIYTRPDNTNPANCFDERGDEYCKARLSVCGTTHRDWKEFMKKYCYKTCGYCSGGSQPTNNPTDTTPMVFPETLKPTDEGETTVETKSPIMTTSETKATGAACVDKAGDYCKGHAARCGTDDPVWKSYLVRNCFKTCFC